MALLRDLVDAILFPNRPVHGIPVLDGALSPNSRLDDARALGAPITAPDDLAPGPDGALYVSSGTTVLRCAGADFDSRRVFADLGRPVGGLAWTPDGRLLACVSGRGVLALTPDGRGEAQLEAVDGAPLRCPTAITVASDGTVFVTDGSRHNPPEDWLQDLMAAAPASGRLVVCDSRLAAARTLKGGLAWPNGVATTADEGALLVTEAWSHSLVSVPRGGGGRVLVPNFAGYPARLKRATDGFWIAFFALRSQLTEFVLREPRFRAQMMAEVPPELWIGPALSSPFNYREPTQIGRIKKLGIQKPWAPARSYGLLARLSPEGDPVESFHSRVGGHTHGITSVCAVGPRVIACAKGHDKLVELPAKARGAH
ncbi:SMP-30/gluconolactonase/LRE family protein [Chelatococcus reniformis]|uniref:Strictosidine synthase conserved region domain-containing protein n=1 Tax=Chelatococcus reniformis TaxID=1494448 RepID=A0A916UUI0_9HYPH|nr:SMP-30/gluconolactonase/LRE family protein [Chelatococcus reniformis]GGC87648.1 hypothetical protein GCM10010994_52030 [Chelatococcus reniformis]